MHTGFSMPGDGRGGGQENMFSNNLASIDLQSGQLSAGTTRRSNRSPSKFKNAWEDTSSALLKIWKFLRARTNLTFWIVVGMGIGILIGILSPDFAVKIGPLGTVFIRMIQCIVGPLIFSTLVVGIAGQGNNLARIGRLALKSVIYFEVVTTIALIFGIIAVNIVRPGDGFDSPPDSNAPPGNYTPITWVTEMEIIVPTSFFLALSDHTAVLAIVFCAIMFGIAITLVKDPSSRKFMLDFNVSLSDIMFKIVDMVMNYAPIGVGCSFAAIVGEFGLDSLKTAGKLIGTLYITLILYVLFVLLPIVWMCRFPMKEFAIAAAQPLVMAFATSSSESALPKAMDRMVEFGVPKDIAAFVIPTGYSFNLDGSTLYLAIAVIFCAQVGGVNKTVGEQIIILLSLMLSSKGVAAVPRASFVVLAATLTNTNTPLTGLAIIHTVDVFMDMARTSVNVLGNMIASAVIAKWEGQFRNAEWIASRADQVPEILAMDETDGDDVRLPLHQHDTNMFQLDQINPMNSPRYGEKASVHSIESARSNFTGQYSPNQGSSGNRQFNNSYDS
ncbi:hypothetical protein BGZ76_002109 [Entomortierella beljakovae]|nr:hypothetical protein BGZ76_002109 [Entomortierella beljakovae]